MEEHANDMEEHINDSGGGQIISIMILWHTLGN
jgi:hypothetical protein